MKKLFALFLLVALVPFAVGCNLWSYDDPDPVVPTTTSKSVRAVVPGSAFGANVRANFSAAAMTITVGGIPFEIAASPAPSYNSTTDTWTVTFEADLTDAQIEAISGEEVDVVIKVGDTTIVNQKVTFDAAIEGATVPAITVTFTAGAFTVTGYAGATTVTVTTTNTATAVTLPTYTVTAVVATVSADIVDLNNTEYTKVATTTPEFIISLDAAYENLTGARWVLEVTEGTLVRYLDSSVTADAALFTVAAYGEQGIKVTLKSSDTRSLKENTDYKVKLMTTSLKNAAGTNLGQTEFWFNTGAPDA